MARFLRLHLALVAATFCGNAHGAKPNILMVVADDLGFADQGFMGNASASITPNLDELGRAGVRLFNHHVQPFCSPTRATLLTGRHVLRYGLQNTVIWPQDPYSIPRNETFLSQNLRAAGYHTAQFGKWHLGLHHKWSLPMARGFDEQYGYYLGGEDYWTHKRNGGLDWHRNDSLAETGDDGVYSADLLAKAAVDFVFRHKAPVEPWFIYLAFQSVHSPLQAPDDCLARYPHLNGSQKKRAAMVSAMDDGIGNITKALRTTGQLEQTVILFTADNGAPFGAAFMEDDDKLEALATPRSPAKRPPTGSGSPPHGGGGGSNYPLSGWKHWVFEGGVRSAAFVHYPGGLQGRREHWGLFHSVDWLPTLVSLAGGTTEQNLPLDGVNIWKALQTGGSTSPRSEIPVNIAACGKDANGTQTIVDGPQAAVIVGDLKLIVDCFWRSTRGLESAQLYNITADPGEEHDLATKRPSDVQKLGERLAYWEAQSVPPYALQGREMSCGEGKPHGKPLAWSPWCDSNELQVVV